MPDPYTRPSDLIRLPDVIAHADWSCHAAKRWMLRATLQENGRYRITPPELVGDPRTLLSRLSFAARRSGTVLVGFDFPIGLPGQYSRRLGIHDFLSLLPQLGRGDWVNFYNVAELPEQIHLRRPFYPRRPGHASQRHLLDRLGFEALDDIRRVCERSRPDRRAASPLFWTLGGQQVGKAAIHGWQNVLVPGLLDPDLNLAIWPFSGKLSDILQPGRTVIAETYPAEVYPQLKIAFSPRRPGQLSGKRVQADRKANGDQLLAVAAHLRLTLAPSLSESFLDGFGSGMEAEDQFDSAVGLLGMLYLILERKEIPEPDIDSIRQVEGWILGQPC